MNPQLRNLQRRFDALSLRERLLLIAAAAAIAVMAADALWLTPATQRFNAARVQQRSALAAHEGLRTDLERQTSRHRAQWQQLHHDLNTWRQRSRDSETALRRFEDTLVGPDKMLALLDRLLAAHGQLRVRNMRTLPREDLLAQPGTKLAGAAADTQTALVANAAAARPLPPAPAASAGTAGNAPAPGQAQGVGTMSPPNKPLSLASGGTPVAASEVSLYRHGVELTLEGGYGDLLAYLQAVEALPERLLWGSLQLKVEQYPTTVLTLRVYTISRERHWLEI